MSPDKLIELVEHFGSARASAALAFAGKEKQAASDFYVDAASALGKIQAEVDAKRVELRDATNDLLDVRGALAPAGYPDVTPLPLVPTVAPAVQWLVDRLAAVEQDRDRLRAVVEAAREWRRSFVTTHLMFASEKALAAALDAYRLSECTDETADDIDEDLRTERPDIELAAEDTTTIQPCQPIGCDNGYHLPGCRYADIDNAEHGATEAGQ